MDRMAEVRRVIFSDIDGTLIDFEHYSPAAARPAVEAALARQTPLVLCSAKTRLEQEVYRAMLKIADPFVVENGSALFVPVAYFPFLPAGREEGSTDAPRLRPFDARYLVVEWGVAATEIRRSLAMVSRQLALPLVGYQDLTPEEVAAVTGLSLEAARLAQAREYSETLVNPLTAAELAQLRPALAQHGLAIVSGGQFYTVTGAAGDKGRAVALLTAWYRRLWGTVLTIGLGDSENDAPLLAHVDRPYLVRRPDGHWARLEGIDAVCVAGVGPVGWRQAVEAEL